MEIHRLFGKRLRALRLRLGLTQEALAAAAGMSSVSISNIERGAYAPAFHRLADLALALRVEVHELFVFEDRWR